MATNYAQNLVFQGLGTITVTPGIIGPVFVESKSTLPTLTAGGGQSQLVTVIQKNGSAVYTGLAGAQGARVDIPITAVTDTISIVYSSSATAIDGAVNAVKSTLAIGQGI